MKMLEILSLSGLAWIATLILSATANAASVDFTSNVWSGVAGLTTTIGDVKLTSSGGNLSFNGSSGERAGCISAGAGLACEGDGIGISNDEITQGGSEVLTVEFLGGSVNVTRLVLLDLFAKERTGEIAVINGVDYKSANGPDNSTMGGYFLTGFKADGISTITLTGNDDSFSDYALARIEYSPVPLPAAAWLFASALVGFGLMSKKRSVQFGG